MKENDRSTVLKQSQAINHWLNISAHYIHLHAKNLAVQINYTLQTTVMISVSHVYLTCTCTV